MKTWKRSVELTKQVLEGGLPASGLGRYLSPRWITPWWTKIDCDSCRRVEIEWIISQQLDVVRTLESYTDFSQLFPEQQVWTATVGSRTEVYGRASECVRRTIREIESFARCVAPRVRLRLISIRERGSTPRVRQVKKNIEVARSRQFIEYLKAMYWYCHGQQAYDALLEGLSWKD